jgi:hypothetical protein
LNLAKLIKLNSKTPNSVNSEMNMLIMLDASANKDQCINFQSVPETTVLQDIRNFVKIFLCLRMQSDVKRQRISKISRLCVSCTAAIILGRMCQKVETKRLPARSNLLDIPGMRLPARMQSNVKRQQISMISLTYA